MDQLPDDEQPFRFLDLPQEIQDEILGYVFPVRSLVLRPASRQVTITLRYYPATIAVTDTSNYNILLVNKTLSRTAQSIINETTTELTVTKEHKLDRSYSSLLLFTHPHTGYDKVRAKITAVTLDRADQDPTSINLSYSQFDVPEKWPSLKTITINHVSERHAFVKYGQTYEEQKTAEYEKLEGFMQGTNDADMEFPVRTLGLRHVAKNLENAGSRIVLYLDSVFAWRAAGQQGVICFSVSFFGVLNRRVRQLTEL